MTDKRKTTIAMTLAMILCGAFGYFCGAGFTTVQMERDSFSKDELVERGYGYWNGLTGEYEWY